MVGGPRVGWADALRLPGRLVGKLVSWAVPAGPDTRAWAIADRVQVTVPGLGAPECGALRRRVVDELPELPGVAWVAVNAVLERVVVGVSDPPATVDEIEQRVAKLV